MPIPRRCPPLLFAVLLLATNAATADGSFDLDTFQRWVTMRVGDGSPVYWFSEGTVRAYPGGRLIATMEGYDTARLDPTQTSPRRAVQLSRKTYIYRDPATGDVFKRSDGTDVAPIAYPYQLISYELKDDGTLETFVDQGSGKRYRRIGPGSSTKALRLDSGVLYNAPLYLDFELPGGNRYQTFENYDFFSPDSDPAGGSFITFLRYGDAPDWATGTDKIVMHLTTRRYDSFADVPARFRTWIEAHAEMWREPPRDMNEIRELQGDIER
ncbi:MAG: hypothetical protein AAFX44_00605 [Pseudomonadota bacterium]